MSFWGWQEVVGTIGVFVLLIAVVTIVIWQLGANRRARMVLAREDGYRALAEKAVTTQESTEQQLVELNSRLTTVQSRLDSVERILSEIE